MRTESHNTCKVRVRGTVTLDTVSEPQAGSERADQPARTQTGLYVSPSQPPALPSRRSRRLSLYLWRDSSWRDSNLTNKLTKATATRHNHVDPDTRPFLPRAL
eukprot:3344957-Rhodomonas_salina.2